MPSVRRAIRENRRRRALLFRVVRPFAKAIIRRAIRHAKNEKSLVVTARHVQRAASEKSVPPPHSHGAMRFWVNSIMKLP